MVDIKMWHRILNIERPTGGNYQDRTVIKAHKKAEERMKTNIANIRVVEEVEFGKSKVKSFSGNHLYIVLYNELCESECKTSFFRVGKICVHRYSCECAEYLVKNTLCKHVHLVCMYEKRRWTNSVLDEIVIRKESEIKKFHKEKINELLIEEKYSLFINVLPASNIILLDLQQKYVEWRICFTLCIFQF
jgi:hypothetical protein